MRRLFLLCTLFAGMGACSKKEKPLPVDNSALIGRWQWNSTTYYRVEANTLRLSSVQPGTSTSFMQFGANSELTLRLLGSPEQGTYSYTPANQILQTSRASGRRETDTVKILTASELILHVKVLDTLSNSPLTIRTFLRIDSLSK